MHSVVHEDAKPFVCAVCNAAFRNVGNRNALNMHYEVLFCNIAFAGSQLVMCVNIRHAILNHVFGSMNATRTQIGQSFRVRKKFVACTRDIHIALGVYTLFANTKRLCRVKNNIQFCYGVKIEKMVDEQQYEYILKITKIYTLNIITRNEAFELLLKEAEKMTWQKLMVMDF